MMNKDESLIIYLPTLDPNKRVFHSFFCWIIVGAMKLGFLENNMIASPMQAQTK